jgi:polysaccharide deacetylase family protein (PEP-CTERM system associated)
MISAPDRRVINGPRNLCSPSKHPAGEVVVSFDVEEHHRIEAASQLPQTREVVAYYSQRLEPATQWLLDRLEERVIKATFFVVGQIAMAKPRLVRSIAERGHEIASHSWDHRRLHQHDAASFRRDLTQCRRALEQASGQRVVGYRAPTFSIVAQNAWAIDVLADEGFLYDSSVFPVRHDRYGIPAAPRTPFRAVGHERELLEFPPATHRFLRWNLPAGGGGYFRLLPLWFLRRAVEQTCSQSATGVAMLYFHPWEFDPNQRRLPLGRVSSFRTYAGIQRSRARLLKLLTGYRFTRAVDVAKRLDAERGGLQRFCVAKRAGLRECVRERAQRSPALIG